LLRGALFVALGTSGCLYDDEDRCGPAMRVDHGVCVCETGTLDENNECVADEPSSGEPELDDVAGAEGSDASMSVEVCSDHEECGDGAFCESGACRPLPTGFGETCESDDDCAGFEASVCTVGHPRGAKCTVANCTQDSCPPGSSCMDVSQFVPGTPPTCLEPFQ